MDHAHAAADEREFVTKSQFLRLKGVNADAREADFVASTGDVDRDGDVLDQSSWLLDAYKANSVVLFQHDQDELPIGVCTKIGVRAGQLECTLRFSTQDLNPLAEQVWRNVQAGVLKAVSVGFLPHDVRYELREDVPTYVLSGLELCEISIVSVPSNRSALAKMKAKALEAAKAAFGHDTNTSPARQGLTPAHATEETGMDVKELQDKIEKQTAAFAKLEVEHKAGSDRLVKTEAEKAALEGKVKALETEKTALDAQTKSLAEARDREKTRADALEEKSVQQEVDALVGKKITPAEKEMFVELRKTNKALFEKMIAQRADLALTESVLSGKPENDSRALADTDLDAEATAEIEKLADS